MERERKRARERLTNGEGERAREGRRGKAERDDFMKFNRYFFP